ncbi:hypothetical protein BC832DRAFT_540691 [Gaertneriomyces semiglobifer]|nr:hypothetical protein BC832DRAFT_540691 [Gaertneriomyces semiglobifer]
MPRPEQRMYTAPHRSRVSSGDTPPVPPTTTQTHPPSPHAWETSVGTGGEKETGGVKTTVGRGKASGGNIPTGTSTPVAAMTSTTTAKGISNTGGSKPRIVHAWEVVEVADRTSPTTATTTMKSADRKNGHPSGDDRVNVRNNLGVMSSRARNVNGAGHGTTQQRRSTPANQNNNNKVKTGTTTRTSPDPHRVTPSNVGDHPSVRDTLSTEIDSDNLVAPHNGTNTTRRTVIDTREPGKDTRSRGANPSTSDRPRVVETTTTKAGSRCTPASGARQPIRFPTAKQEWDSQNHTNQGVDSGSGVDDDLEIDDFFTPRPHNQKQHQQEQKQQRGDTRKHTTQFGQGRDTPTSERTRTNAKEDEKEEQTEQGSEAGEILNPYLPIPSRHHHQHHHQQQQGSSRRPGSASSPHRYAHTPPRNSYTPPRNSYTPPRHSQTPPRHTPSTRSLSPHSWTPSSSHSLTNNNNHTNNHNNNTNKNSKNNKHLAVPQDIHIPISISVSEPSYSKTDHSSSAHTTPPATPPSPSSLATSPLRTDASQHKQPSHTNSSHTDSSHTKPLQNADSPQPQPQTVALDEVSPAGNSHTHEPSKSPQKPWASLVTGSWADDDGDIDYEVIPVWKPGGTK